MDLQVYLNFGDMVLAVSRKSNRQKLFLTLNPPKGYMVTKQFLHIPEIPCGVSPLNKYFLVRQEDAYSEAIMVPREILITIARELSKEDLLKWLQNDIKGWKILKAAGNKEFLLPKDAFYVYFTGRDSFFLTPDVPKHLQNRSGSTIS